MPSFLLRLFKDQDGQSLVEILVGLAIGALLIGTATIGVVFVVRSSTVNQNLGAASDFTKGILDNVRTFAAADWSNITGLSHGASSTYFMVASGTLLFAVPGEEGVVGNDVQNGLIGHWGLDEGTGTVTYDESGNGNSGTLYNNPAWLTGNSCKLGDCLSFNGSNTYVNVNQFNNEPSGNAPFTITAWISPNNLSGAHVIACFGTDAGPPNAYGIYTSGVNPVGSFSSSNGVVTGDINLVTGQWYQVTGVYTGSVNNLYLDGTLVGSLNYGGGDIIQGPLEIGVWCNYQNNPSSNQFSGTIDDVRLYNRALSASEVKQIYDSQFFSRYFYVQDVCRTNDASSSIVGVAPCTGSNWDDPLTQEVTAETTWNAGPSMDQTTLSTYLTNYNNFTLRQTDWSGGGGQTGPLSIPDSQYASSTNITGTSTYGSFEIENLSQQ